VLLLTALAMIFRQQTHALSQAMPPQVPDKSKRAQPGLTALARNGIASGVAALDACFAHQATQDVRRRASVCWLAVHAKTGQVAGERTLADRTIKSRTHHPHPVETGRPIQSLRQQCATGADLSQRQAANLTCEAPKSPDLKQDCSAAAGQHEVKRRQPGR
jgi:hypothetical protein